MGSLDPTILCGTIWDITWVSEVATINGPQYFKCNQEVLHDLPEDYSWPINHQWPQYKKKALKMKDGGKYRRFRGFDKLLSGVYLHMLGGVNGFGYVGNVDDSDIPVLFSFCFERIPETDTTPESFCIKAYEQYDSRDKPFVYSSQLFDNKEDLTPCFYGTMDWFCFGATPYDVPTVLYHKHVQEIVEKLWERV